MGSHLELRKLGALHFARPQVKAGMSELRAMVEFDQWHLGHEKLAKLGGFSMDTWEMFAKKRPRLRLSSKAQEAVAGRQDLDGSVFPHAVLGQPRWGRQGRTARLFWGQNSVPKLWQVTRLCV